MRLDYLLKIIIVISLLSCSESKEPEVACKTYYLYSAGPNVQAYYNTDGLISEYTNGTDTIAKFEYNVDKQIKRRKLRGFDTYYYYDGTKKLNYLLEYDDGIFRDSVKYEFNAQNLISVISSYSHRDQPATKIQEFQYTNKNAIKLLVYIGGKLTSTFLFEYDTKMLPYPKETWPNYVLFQDGSISENNVTKQVVKVAGQPDSESIYTYVYNNDGYPLEVKINNSLALEFSYSCEPRLRGTK